MPLIIPSNSISGEYEVANSLRFDDGSSDNLIFTPSGAGNRKTNTTSFWLKRANLGTMYFNAWYEYGAGKDHLNISFQNGDQLTIENYTGTSLDWKLRSNQVFRDVSAWYHIVISIDTTQSTSTDRAKMYVNGNQITSFSTSSYPALNSDTAISQAQPTRWGVSVGGAYYDGYLAEAVLVDGSALTPTSFGEFDEDTGIWKPIDVSGLSFGSNGFYLPFENSGALGQDDSGNGNNFTVNNLTSIDQTTDTCTNNFATLNPLTKRSGGTLAEGNLKYTASTGDSSVFGTIGIPSGMKVYFEAKLVNNTAQNFIGIFDKYDAGDGATLKGGSESGSYGYKVRGSASVVQYFNNGSGTDTAISNYANGTIIGIAIDNENGQIHLSANGTYINSSDPTDNNPSALVTGFDTTIEQYLHFSLDTTASQPSVEYNFGNPPYSISSGNSDGNGFGNFEYSVPSGYYALNTKNLAEYG